MDFQKLSAEFPKADIHWRAQSVTKDGSKALALAYIDARHVMDRLDQVCGPNNWQDRYEVEGSKTICYLSIKIADEWTTKSDGAGDTAVEAEKGSISDAFKRAAVKWGIGRYLYAMTTPWVACESYKGKDGKPRFKRFTQDPWQVLNGTNPTQSAPTTKKTAREIFDDLVTEMQTKDTMETLEVFVKSDAAKAAYNSLPDNWKEDFQREVSICKAYIINPQKEAAE